MAKRYYMHRRQLQPSLDGPIGHVDNDRQFFDKLASLATIKDESEAVLGDVEVVMALFVLRPPVGAPPLLLARHGSPWGSDHPSRPAAERWTVAHRVRLEAAGSEQVTAGRDFESVVDAAIRQYLQETYEWPTFSTPFQVIGTGFTYVAEDDPRTGDTFRVGVAYIPSSLSGDLMLQHGGRGTMPAVWCSAEQVHHHTFDTPSLAISSMKARNVLVENPPVDGRKKYDVAPG